MTMFKRKQIDFESTAVQARVAGFQRALYLLLREFPNVCAKIQALFSENDADGDGVMSLNEFKELIAAMAEDAAGHEPPLLIQRYRAGKRTLDVADSFVFIDADGARHAPTLPAALAHHLSSHTPPPTLSLSHRRLGLDRLQ